MNPKKPCFVKKGVRVGSKGSWQKKKRVGGSGRSASPRNTDAGVRVCNKGSGLKKKKSGWGGAGGRAQRLPPQCVPSKKYVSTSLGGYCYR